VGLLCRVSRAEEDVTLTSYVKPATDGSPDAKPHDESAVEQCDRYIGRSTQRTLMAND
jgi:hypothetical protein